MSCFAGRMKEYERISLDRFDGKNLQSTVFFLSHLHEDHTVGLATPVFFKHLKTSKNVCLYCSEVTEVLIQASNKYRHLVPYIKTLGINTPTTIEIPDPLFDEVDTVTVTFLPAFHCPGSVMCLFEGNEGTVLYTGDFRWEHFHIEQMYHLRSGESVKKLKSLYIDTTFCKPENLYIPSRQHCIDATYQLVCEWISQSPQHVVYMSLRAQYGHEPLLNAVACRLGKKVHVAKHKVEVYNQIQEFQDNFTSDGSSTQIHACGKELQNIDGEVMPCRQRHDPDKILWILPTTMYFTQFQHLTLDKIVRKIDERFYRVCYSFHSSYTELKDLISYLRPVNVYPNVKPPNDSKLAVVQHRLNIMLKECLEASEAGEDMAEIAVKELGTLKTGGSKRVAAKRKQQAISSDTESLDFGTPTKVQKTETQSQRPSRGKGSNSQETETENTPLKGRRSARQAKSSVEVATETPARTSTRLRSKKASESDIQQQKTPVKKQKSRSPDIFLTPVKSEQSDISERQSSYAGSHGDDSEIDLTLSQKSLDLELSSENKGDHISSWTGGSFLSAVSSHSSADSDGCVCLVEDVEQTDENFEDISQIVAEEETEGLSLEDVEHMETEKNRKTAKKPPVRKGRKSKGKTSPKDSKSNISPVTVDDDCEMVKGSDNVEDTKEADQSSKSKTTPKDRKSSVSPITIDDDADDCDSSENLKGTDNVQDKSSNKSKGQTTPKDRKNNVSPISIDDDDCDSSENLKGTDNVHDQSSNKSKGQTTPKDRKNNVSPISIDDDDCDSSENLKGTDNVQDKSSNKSKGQTTPKDRKNNVSPISIDDDDCDSSENLKGKDHVHDQSSNKSKGQTTPKDSKSSVSPITIDDDADDCDSSEKVKVKDNVQDTNKVDQSSNKSQIKEMSESNLDKTESNKQTLAANEGRSSRHKTNKQTTEQTLDTRRNTEDKVSPSEAESCSVKKKEIVSQCNLAKGSEVTKCNTNKSKVVIEDNSLALKSDGKTKVIKNISNESSNSPKIDNPEMHTKDVKSVDSVAREQGKGGLVYGTEKDKLRISNTSSSEACSEPAQASDEDVIAIDKNQATEKGCPPNTSKKENTSKADAGVSKSDADIQKAVPTKSSALGVDSGDKDFERKTKAVVICGDKTEVDSVGKNENSDITHKTATKSSVRCAEDSIKECKGTGISRESLKLMEKKDSKEDMDSKDDHADSSGSSKADKEGTSEKVKDSTKTSELAKNGDKGNDNEPSSANIIKETCKAMEKTINEDKETGKPQCGKVQKPEKSKEIDKSSKESSNRADGSIIKEPDSACGLEESSKAVEHPDEDDGLEGLFESLEDICTEDLSKAISESLNAQPDLFDEPDSLNKKSETLEVIPDLDKVDDKVENASSSNSHDAVCDNTELNKSDLESALDESNGDSDVIMDTPPSETSLLGGKLFSGTPSAVKSTHVYYTRHWPLPSSGLTKQERRRKRKRKQKKKKYAALRGCIFYDSDCEIVVKNEDNVKVLIDLTAEHYYDEHDFEYDVRKKLKQSREDKASEDKLITVFKTEKDDDHLYGGRKSVRRLKYTRRRSFEFCKETDEDAEFISELEAALSEKGKTQTNDENIDIDIKPVVDPLYQELIEPPPLESEYEKFMSGIDTDKKNESNNEGNRKTYEKGEKLPTGQRSEKEDSKTTIDVENSSEKGNETSIGKDKEDPKLNKDQDNEETSSKIQHKQSNIQYTETSGGKKLMRLSLSTKKKFNAMPRQSYLGTDLFIDLSNEDGTNDTIETKTDLVSEKSNLPDAEPHSTHISVSKSCKDSKENAVSEAVQNDDLKVNDLDTEKQKKLIVDQVLSEDSVTDTEAKESQMNIDQQVESDKSSPDVLHKAPTSTTNTSVESEKENQSKKKETVDEAVSGKSNDSEIIYIGDTLNEAENSNADINKKDLDVVYVADDEDSNSSHSSGEWLSCAKAIKEKQNSNNQKTKPRTKLKQRVPVDKSKQSVNLAKVPAVQAIDKYVKHINNPEKSKSDSLSSVGRDLSQRERRKREKIKRKALDKLFDTDDEGENKQSKSQETASTENLYDETVSLSSDSDLDEEIFQKSDSPKHDTSNLKNSDKNSNSKTANVEVQGGKKLWQDSEQATAVQTSSVPQSSNRAPYVKRDKQSGLIQITKSKTTKTDRKTKSDWISTQAQKKIPTHIPSSQSQKQPKSQQKHDFATSGFYNATPPNFNVPPPSLNVPPPSFNAPPPSFNAPPPSINVPPPSFNIPPPSFSLNQNVTIPPFTVSPVLKTQSVDTATSSSPLFPATNSLLSSMPLTTTAVDTLNAVLDVILKTNASSKTDTQTTISGPLPYSSDVQNNSSFPLLNNDLSQSGNKSSQEYSVSSQDNYWHRANRNSEDRDRDLDSRYAPHGSRERRSDSRYRPRDREVDRDYNDSSYDSDQRRNLEEVSRHRRPERSISPVDRYNRFREDPRERSDNYDSHRSRRSSDPYYDHPPPARLSDRMSDPYYDDHPRLSRERYEDRYDDRLRRYDERHDDRYSRYDDRHGRFDDNHDRFNDRPGRYDDRPDRYDDRHRYDDRPDRYDDRQDRYDDRQDRYDDRQDRYDDRHERFDDIRDRFDDRRERLDDRFDHRHDRFADRRGRMDERYDRFDRQDRYNRRDRYEDRDTYRHDGGIYEERHGPSRARNEDTIGERGRYVDNDSHSRSAVSGSLPHISNLGQQQQQNSLGNSISNLMGINTGDQTETATLQRNARLALKAYPLKSIKPALILSRGKKVSGVQQEMFKAQMNYGTRSETSGKHIVREREIPAFCTGIAHEQVLSEEEKQKPRYTGLPTFNG